MKLIKAIKLAAITSLTCFSLKTSLVLSQEDQYGGNPAVEERTANQAKKLFDAINITISGILLFGGGYLILSFKRVPPDQAFAVIATFDKANEVVPAGWHWIWWPIKRIEGFYPSREIEIEFRSESEERNREFDMITKPSDIPGEIYGAAVVTITNVSLYISPPPFEEAAANEPVERNKFIKIFSTYPLLPQPTDSIEEQQARLEEWRNLLQERVIQIIRSKVSAATWYEANREQQQLKEKIDQSLNQDQLLKVLIDAGGKVSVKFEDVKLPPILVETLTLKEEASRRKLGTDITAEAEKVKKLKQGEADSKYREELLKLWSAYPDQKGQYLESLLAFKEGAQSSSNTFAFPLPDAILQAIQGIGGASRGPANSSTPQGSSSPRSAAEIKGYLDLITDPVEKEAYIKRILDSLIP